MGVVLLCTWWRTMLSLTAILLLYVGCCHGGLLGAGTGDGSCRAAPYRAVVVQWAGGCPAHASCCSEYGYCRTKEEWLEGSETVMVSSMAHLLHRMLSLLRRLLQLQGTG